VSQVLDAANDGAASGLGILKIRLNDIQIFKGFVDLYMEVGEVRWGLVLGYGCVSWVV